MMCRKFWTWSAAASLAIAAAACGGDDGAVGSAGEDGQDEGDWPEMTITFSSPLPAGGLNSAFDWWAEELEERTDGAITAEAHYSASLMGATETLPALQDGRIEVGHISAVFNPSDFPLWGVQGVPFQTEDPGGQMRAFHELYEEHELYREEWERNGVHLIMQHALPPAVMGLEQEIDAVDDLKGVRVRMVGYSAAALEALGMETVAMDPAELYEAIQRGVVDGFGAFPFDIVVPSGLHEVAPHIYDLGIGHYASTAVAVSQVWWDGLDPKVQDLMTELGQEFMDDHAVGVVTELEETSCEQILEHANVNIFDESQIAEVQDRVGDAAVDRWLQEAQASGLEEADVVEFRELFLEKYEQHQGAIPYEKGSARCAERSS